MEIKKQISLEVVHPNACGIDIGSRRDQYQNLCLSKNVL